MTIVCMSRTYRKESFCRYFFRQSYCNPTKHMVYLGGKDGEEANESINKRSLAIRVMLDLAVNNTGEYIPLKDVSERQGITLKYLEQIIILLKRSGYLKSSRGNGGGYKLAKAPKEYTIGDILRTTEGSLSPVACLEDDENMCPRSSMCTTINFWEGLDKVINDYVDSVTLQDLLDRQQELVGNDYSI